MTVVTIHQAKTNLSKLIAQVLGGEEVVIARGDKPVVKLSPLEDVQPRRVFGSMKGALSIDQRFFEPLPAEDLALWEGGD
ncbi:MAG: type II toxin-antitoxin system Phd/YefM family antitoxin [Caulobacteraceae bacterium]